METRRVVLSMAFLLVSGCLASAASPVEVSLVQLIATPERFDGKQVRVIGYCWLEFEGDALYLSPDDHANNIFRNAVWLTISREKREEWFTVRGKYADVTGTFRAKHHGHLGMFAAEIDGIQALALWSDPAKPGIPPPPEPKSPHPSTVP
jgi:hypothetical protein